MIEITTHEQAKELIANNEFVSFIWHSDTCLVCEYFLEDLKGIEDDCPDFIHATINKSNFKGDLMFVPSQFPWTFIFKNGERVSSPAGQTPRESILNRYNDIITGAFKSQEQLEQEQLELLETTET
jgi:hypothetical protein